MSGPALPTARTADFRGWPAVYLENDLIRLVAVPAIGGRIMAYDLGPYPYFFVDPDLAGKLFSAEENQGDGSLAAWKNYGGDKTWPAPQGWDNDQQWHGPPDPLLDTGVYTLDYLSARGERATMRLVSPPDPKTGVQIARQFTISAGSSRVAVDLAFTNILDKPITWSIWDVVQLRAEQNLTNGTYAPDTTCFVTTPLHPRSRFPRGYNVMFGAENNPQWRVDDQNGLFQAQYLWEIGKVGIDSPGGWIAFSHGSSGYAFAERFAYDPDGQYPDEGATVECWTVGAGQVANLDYGDTEIYLMETEVLSPMQTIAPGGTATMAIEWGVNRCPGPITQVTEGGCAGVPLKATAEGGYCRLTGQMGVFDSGELSLAWIDSLGQVLHRDSLGPVDPLSAVLIDRVLPLPAGAVEAQCQVAAGPDRHFSILSSALVE